MHADINELARLRRCCLDVACVCVLIRSERECVLFANAARSFPFRQPAIHRASHIDSRNAKFNDSFDPAHKQAPPMPHFVCVTTCIIRWSNHHHQSATLYKLLLLFLFVASECPLRNDDGRNIRRQTTNAACRPRIKCRPLQRDLRPNDGSYCWSLCCVGLLCRFVASVRCVGL